MTEFFAHTALSHDGTPAGTDFREPLELHLNQVSATASSFAEAFGAKEWAGLAARWHDLGKYSSEFQRYPRQASGHSDPHGEDLTSTGGRVDHSSSGAKHCAAQGQLRQLLACVIAGHPAGLPDGVELRERLAKKVAVWDSLAPNYLARSATIPRARELGKRGEKCTPPN